MENELEFLESLMKADDTGTELQFFKEKVYETKLKIVNRILMLRKFALDGNSVNGEKHD